MSEIIRADFARRVFPLQPCEGPVLSDDECVARLASELEARNDSHLDEVARLIGRLAVTIE
jgi:hypothetical protein